MDRPPRGSLPGFLLLTFAWSWAWFGAARLMAAASSMAMATPLVMVGVFGPALAAIVVTARARGADGVQDLLAPAWPTGLRARWMLFALGFMPLVKLVTAVIFRVSQGHWPDFGKAPLPLLPFAIAISTPFQSGEEVGWRGFLLARWAVSIGLGAASIGVGVMWAVWHLPLFFVQGADTEAQSFPLYLVQVSALSVVFAWVWARAGGSLFTVMLLHATINNVKGLVPAAPASPPGVWSWAPSPLQWIGSALLVLAALACLVTMPALARSGTNARATLP